ncbi:unnamed protein product, partial [Allacma fusca]
YFLHTQMQSTKRSALPIRVHYIWDAIDRGNTGAQGPVDFERLMSIVTSIHKLPRDEINRELENAMKDQLVVSDVIQTQKREETEIYKLPDRDFTKGDHDWYCFQCHAGGGGAVVACEDCPRIFHLDCLPDDKKPQKDLFVCPPCSLMTTKPSLEYLNLKPKQLNTLLEYSCVRFHDWGASFLNSADGKLWATSSGREVKDEWRYEMLVYFPIDLTQMLEKARTTKYTCLEEFQIDCETLIHGIGVYFGSEQLKGQQVTAAFMREVMHDIQEIKLCPDCFRRSNEKDHLWWFCLPCATPHAVCWAKQSGYPYWPAKIMKKDGSKFDVRYFGGNYERGMIDEKNIQPIDTPLSSLRIRRTAAWNDAYDELQKFQEIAANPEKVNSLPPTKGSKGASPSKAGATSKARGSKRAATASPAEEVTQKKARKSAGVARKSAPIQTSTPVTGRARKSVASGLNSSVTANSSSVQTNGVTLPTKKKTATPKASGSTPHRRDSTSRNLSTSPTTAGRSRVLPKDESLDVTETLDADDLAFINAFDELGDDSLSGDAYFSDEEQDEHLDKVSEDAVSSSVNETSGSRNVYVQTNVSGLTGRVELIRENVVNYLASLKKRHAQEISALKKKQWCYHCEREAIYHCCWNTAYCSIECQQLHWTKEHKRLCRRVRRDRSGTGSNSQGTDDY